MHLQSLKLLIEKVVPVPSSIIVLCFVKMWVEGSQIPPRDATLIMNDVSEMCHVSFVIGCV